MTDLPPLRIAEFNSLLTGGGTDGQSVRVAAALQRLGHAVHLIGPADQEYARLAHERGLAVHDVRMRGLRRWIVPLQMARFLTRERVQILQARHGRDYGMALAAGRLSRARPRVVVCRQLAKSPRSWWSRRLLLRQCDAMVVVSEFVAKVLREGVRDPDSPEAERHYRPPMSGKPQKVHVIYDGFETDRFHPTDGSVLREAWGLAPGDFAFGVAGGYVLPRGKGQREFLRAAARIHREIPEARFLLIGRGNMRTVLEVDIHKLGLQGKAWLTPWCEDMPAAMNALDCLVHPQIGTEALGGVLIEAQACGRPVIASDLDGIPEAVAATGYGQLVRPDSVDELAAAMRIWARRPRPPFSERLALHRKVEERFSVEAIAGQFVQLYRELLRVGITTHRPGRGPVAGVGSK